VEPHSEKLHIKMIQFGLCRWDLLQKYCLPHARRAPRLSHPSWFKHCNSINS